MCFLLALLTVVAYGLISPGPTYFNEHVLLSQTFLAHHLYVTVPSYIEHFTYNGHSYLVQPPGVALLLLPFVWLCETVNQTHASWLIGGGAIAAAYDIPKCNKLWLSIFLAFGTIIAHQASLGDSWGIALIASAACSLLAIREFFNNKDPLRIGLYAGFAALCRYDLILALPFYWLMFERRDRAVFTVTVLPFLGFLGWYNYARFGNPFTTDLSIYAKSDPQAHGQAPFQLRYLVVNLNTLLFMPPDVNQTWPYLHPHFGGQALLWTSPAFLSAGRVRERSKRVYCLALMTICCALPSLLVYANGYVQFGARYYIQVYPFLFALLALHADEAGLDRFDRAMILCSLVFTLGGIWHIRALGWNW